MSAAATPEIWFYNTLGRERQRFAPLVPGEVRMYTCGPTVYDRVHIGNLRTFLFEDVLRRSLAYLGLRVVQVMNLTDVDDRTILAAQRAGVALDELTAPHIATFFEDLDTLHVERAEHYPRATRHVPEMIDLIDRLLAGGHAYAADGSIWFRIAAARDYGRLSGIDLDGVRRGERVAEDSYEKEDGRDFVLWKGAKPGEPAWESPWGPGRPGWHIECSAMSARYLGETFDLHCGGVDNIFPHHENEIAQSESASGRPFVRYWLHADHLIVDGQKMSKSLGNQYTLPDLRSRGLAPRALRYLFLSVHYRQKLNFTFDSVEAAAAGLRRFDEMRFRLAHAAERPPGETAPATAVATAAAALKRDFAAALADDLNVSAALGAVHLFARAVNVAVDEGRLFAGDRDRAEAAVAQVDRVLGVLDPTAWERPAAVAAADEAALAALVRERDEARARRDFAAADRIRAELAAGGVILEDTPQGTRWKRR